MKLLTIVALAGALGGLAARPQDPVFSSRVDGVRIDALVTANGRPVTDLGPGDFEVRDNGVRQTVDLVRLGDVAINVVLTFDVSSSVDGPALERLKAAGASLLDALTDGDTAALITFNSEVVQHVPLTRDLSLVRTALAAARAGGDTALVDAVTAALLRADSDASRTLVVVFSDGVDTASFVPASDALDTARGVNGVLYGVSARSETPEFLRELAEATGGRVLATARGGDPAAAFLEILQEFRRRYVLTFTPTDVGRGGWHTLNVRVTRPGARVQARRGYISGAR